MKKQSLLEYLNRRAFKASQRLRKARKTLARSREWFGAQNLADDRRWRRMEIEIERLQERADYWMRRAHAQS